MDKQFMHYASPYYDPVKAHEYYMRTRELKGRRSTSKLSDEGKKIWSYTKNSIKEEKTAKVEAEKEKRNQQTEQLRVRASETRDRISEKLKELNELLSKQAVSKKEAIEKQKQVDLENARKKAEQETERLREKMTAEIEKLMAVTIPKSLSKEERAKRIAERNEKIARLRSDASAEKTKLSENLKSEKADVNKTATSSKDKVTEDTKANRLKNSKNVSVEREACSQELKTAVAAAREAYKAAKTELDSSYEEIFQREYDSILAKHAKPTKSKSSGLDKYRIKK